MAFISLSKDGGVIPGNDEKFAADPTTGAANGPLGFAGNLWLPQITRKTGKKLTQYRE